MHLALQMFLNNDAQARISCLRSAFPTRLAVKNTSISRSRADLAPISLYSMVERVFRDLTQNRLRRGIFREVGELITAIGAYIDQHNQIRSRFSGQPCGTQFEKSDFVSGREPRLVTTDLLPGVGKLPLGSAEGSHGWKAREASDCPPHL
jgi:hypothetical protein